MDTKTDDYFTLIIQQVQAVCTKVTSTIDTTPERAILRLQAIYGHYQVFITEVLDQEGRTYRYYVLSGMWVEAGFDNSADARALRLKYGRIGRDHAGETIPHLHRADKTQLELTEEMTVNRFLQWLQEHLPREHETT